MNRELKITIIQADLVWQDKQANFRRFEQKIGQIETSTDLIVLPEMFTTGFSMTPAAFAEDMNGETVDWLTKQAETKQCAFMGSFIVKENGAFYNRLICMYPNGKYECYDKRHLFRMANEHHHYSPGNKRLVLDINGWRICTMICYDLRFPVWSRNRTDYDVLVYIANWPQSRSGQWKILAKARAIENQAFVVAVNRVGEDGNNIRYAGDSLVINPKGEAINHTPSQTESIETLSLLMDDLQKFRYTFPFYLDADKFEIC